MTISIGSDHGGKALKDYLVQLLSADNTIIDCGTNTTDSCDYPDYGQAVAHNVASGISDRGIVVCTTGIGISIAANKVKGIRCALCTNADMATMSRRHNNSNVLALGAKYTDADMAKSIVEAFLTEQFEGGRHQLRVDKISNIERNCDD